MKLIKKYTFLLWLLFIDAKAFAQTDDAQNQRDFMTANGKIYVVMAVVIVIVLGLFIYLFNLDKKINRLEKNSRK